MMNSKTCSTLYGIFSRGINTKLNSKQFHRGRQWFMARSFERYFWTTPRVTVWRTGWKRSGLFSLSERSLSCFRLNLRSNNDLKQQFQYSASHQRRGLATMQNKPAASTKADTGIVRQYNRFVAEYPDSIIFFRNHLLKKTQMVSSFLI